MIIKVLSFIFFLNKMYAVICVLSTNLQNRHKNLKQGNREFQSQFLRSEGHSSVAFSDPACCKSVMTDKYPHSSNE